MKPLSQLVRPNILNLKPYSSARDEFTGEASIYLDANESAYNEPYNRYPDPYQRNLKQRIAEIKQVDADQIFLGNGSDEPIDLLIKAFCTPGSNNIVTIDPTYGMYQVAADINNVEVKKVKLTPLFELDADALLRAVDANTKLIFICSPNNPTGNTLNRNEIKKVLTGFNSLVVLDEAYIDFASEEGFLQHLNQYPNLVILQTLSKAWAMAGLRLGMAFASAEITAVLSKIKYPYNINILTQQKVFELLNNSALIKEWTEIAVTERERMKKSIGQLPYIQKIYPSDANFLLIKTTDATHLYNYLTDNKIVIRNRTNVSLCENCVRITIGTPEENNQLLRQLETYQKTQS